MEFNFDVHYSKIGWIKGLENYDILMFKDKRIEALNVICERMFSVDLKLEKKEESDNQAEYITTISAVKNFDSDINLYYRVFANDKWSDFYSNCNSGSNLVLNGMIRGIQFFYSTKLSDDEILLAEEKREQFEYYSKHLFLKNSEDALFHITRNYKDDQKATAKTVESGLILPLEEIPEIKGVKHAAYKGGVVDSSFNFISGFDRKAGQHMNFTCIIGYKPDKYISSNETVIYAGILFSGFGHILFESVSRLWWVVEHPENSDRILFLVQKDIGDKRDSAISVLKKIFSILGIDEKRLGFVDEPIKFDRVIVPDQLIRLHSDVKAEYADFYRNMAHRIADGQKRPEKIYLTRTHLSKNDGINEIFFERFYENRGFFVLAPEEHSIEDQIRYLNSAKEVVCTIGTLSHLSAFCEKDTKLTIIRRDDSEMLTPQTVIDNATNLEVYYVDGTFNILPTRHVAGLFLYGPTQEFINYLQDRNIEYSVEEVAFDIKDFIAEYVIKWNERYNKVGNFRTIAYCDIFDVLQAMNNALGNPSISRKKYVTKAKETEKKLKETEKKLKETEKKLKETQKKLEIVLEKEGNLGVK